MPRTHLTASERETVILLDDASDVAIVSTHQRRVITRLERNPLARKVEDLTAGGSVGARFELPAWAITFRSKPRQRTAGSGRGFASHSRALEDAEMTVESVQ